MRKANVSGKWIAAGGAALTVVLIGVIVQSARGYPEYRQNVNGGYCVDCHGDFDGPTSPKGTLFPEDSKHEMHRGASHMNTECALCHMTADPPAGDVPFTYQSLGTVDTPGFGCVGCHGRDYGGKWPNGVGLRQHHELHDVTQCQNCHGNPAPLPENIDPPYYGSPDTNADDSCNQAPGFLENWSVNNPEGLDNDGDDLYDENDPDCAVACPCDCADGGDGVVNVVDFLALIGEWGTAGACDCADGGDGTVNVVDFLAMIGVWGPC
ncbi:MAG: hypothetical protein ACYSUF_08875 [Planctomycetota bacterium]|jgi:hypothetical protein